MKTGEWEGKREYTMKSCDELHYTPSLFDLLPVVIYQKSNREILEKRDILGALGHESCFYDARKFW